MLNGLWWSLIQVCDGRARAVNEEAESVVVCCCEEEVDVGTLGLAAVFSVCLSFVEGELSGKERWTFQMVMCCVMRRVPLDRRASDDTLPRGVNTGNHNLATFAELTPLLLEHHRRRHRPNRNLPP